MPRRPISGRNAFEHIRPRTPKERNQLLAVMAIILVGILGAGTLMYVAQRSREYREQNWYSAMATIKDARTQLVAEVGSQYGGRMLYEVQVLAAFSANGSSQERWITVSQPAQNLDYAEFQERMWRGKQYFVRWKPSDPDQIVIELH
jgi:hypothetical protein